MKTLFNDGRTVPTAFVTKGRQRVKQYSGHGNGSVYLNDGDEFEIELFNPTSKKVLAVIELNGVSIGNAGIVLRPGERVFLERYLEIAKKFLFETYEVDKNNPDVRKAIANNGKVEVKFYDEYTYYGGISYTGDCTWMPWSQPSWTYTSSHTPGDFTSPGVHTKEVDHTVRGIVDNSVFYSQSVEANSLSFADPVAGAPQASLGEEKSLYSRSFAKKSMETGRVEQGSHSNQKFSHDSTQFNTWWTWKSEWNILPLSQKPLLREDIKNFCPNCGARQKKQSHKFCPNCGGRY